MGVFAVAAAFSVVTVLRMERLSLRPTSPHPLCAEESKNRGGRPGEEAYLRLNFRA